MTSEDTQNFKGRRISHFTYQRLIYQRRSACLILTSVLLFLYYVVGMPAFILYSRSDSTAAEALKNAGTFKAYLAQRILLGFDLGVPAVLLISLLAVVNGLSVFSYLFNRRVSIFYRSLPISRRVRFRERYLNGFFSFLIPFAVCSLISWFIAIGMSAITKQMMKGVIYGAARMVVFYLAIYSLVILSAMLSGKAVFALLLFLFFSLAEIAANVLVGLARSAFFYTYYARNSSWYDQYRLVTSPIFTFFLGRHRMKDLITPEGSLISGYRMVRVDLSSFFWMLALAVIFTCLALLAQHWRRIEMAGESITFQPIRVLTKAACGFLLGSFLAILGESLLWRLNSGIANVLLLPLAAIMTVLMLMLFDAITRVDVRSAFQPLWPVLLTAGLSVCFLAVFRFDLIGYDKYIPKTSKVKSAGIYLLSTGNARVFDGKSMQMNMQLTQIDAVERIAEIGQRELCKYPDDSTASLSSRLTGQVLTAGRTSDTRHEEAGFDALVVYEMKDGSSVYRKMLIPYDISAEYMDPILSSEAYQQSWFRFAEASQLPQQANLSLTYGSGYTSRSVADTKGLMEEFIHAYNADLIQYSYSFVKENDPIGTIRWSTDTSNFNYEVYASYTNTIAFLRKYSLYTSRVPSERQVGRLTLVRQEKSARESEYWEDLSPSGQTRLESSTDRIDGKRLGSVTDVDGIEEVLGSSLLNDGVRADWKDDISPKSDIWVEEEGETVCYRLAGTLKTDEGGSESIAYTFHGKPAEEILALFEEKE
jgi:ABC-2 type transport system permease protein